MQIENIGLGDHYLLVNKKGFCFAMLGVQTHYLVPMRLLLNLAYSEGENAGMNTFVNDAHGIIFREFPTGALSGKTIREVCAEFEVRNILDFYNELSKEEKREFNALFEGPEKFGQSPLYAFRNSGGVDFV